MPRRGVADAQDLEQAAGRIHVGHDRVVDARVEERFESGHAGERLAAGQPHAGGVGLRAQPAQRGKVPRFFRQRAFEPVEAQRFELAQDLAGRGLGQPPVAVDQQRTLGPYGVAHRGNALDAGRHQAAPLGCRHAVRTHVVERRDLDRSEAAARRCPRTRGKAGRAALERAAIDIGVKLDRGPAGTAERVRERLAALFARRCPRAPGRGADRGGLGALPPCVPAMAAPRAALAAGD
ncbi:MAG: hypothetical protein IPI73_25085 [Betaproteobacteria bacterium]|nr:hypothetical protein [Betaproteobacteria bacterium]